MGWAARDRIATATSLLGLRVVVDVQHLYRASKPHDKGSEYVLANGTHIAEANAARVYADGLCDWLRERGVAVLTNDPTTSILTGFYSSRNRAAHAFAAHAYLACHLNAGRGGYCLMEYMDATVSKPLADAIGARLATTVTEITDFRSQALHAGDRGAVCIERVMPPIAAVLCEPFFGDTPAHQYLLASVNLREIGATIGQGVADWWLRKQDATGPVAGSVDGT